MDRYEATNRIQSPNLRQAIADANANNSVLLGTALGIPSIPNAKVVAASSSDFVWVDAEHTAYSPSLLTDIILTLKMFSQGKTIPIVRVPSHSNEWVTWALDAGAGGVIIPHTETVEQVKASIAAARFPPHGHRSYAPFAVIPRLQDTAPQGKTWMDVASEHCAVIPQIESRLGVENLEAIMQIPGVDAIMIGSTDLMLDIGVGKDTELSEAHARIEALARKYHMPLLGVMPQHMQVKKYEAGYRMFLSIADVWILASGIETSLKDARKALKLYTEGKGSADTEFTVKL